MADSFDQGGFNGLQGVSSIVNAVSMLVPNKKIKNDDLNEVLFKKLVEFLEKEKQLKKVIFEGISLPLMKKLLKTTEDFLVANCKIKFVYKNISSSSANISQVWADMSNFLSKADKKTPLYIIVNLQRKHNTWTCVKKISDKQMTLQDASLSLINKANCTAGSFMEGGHKLSGDAIFGVCIEQPKTEAKPAPAKKVVAKKPAVKKAVAKPVAKAVAKKPVAKPVKK